MVMENEEDNFEKFNIEFGKNLGKQREFHRSCRAGHFELK